MWETLYGMLLAYPIVCFVFVPVYYSLGITSIYQYLDMRWASLRLYAKNFNGFEIHLLDPLGYVGLDLELFDYVQTR